jgi:hypothetical protein
MTANIVVDTESLDRASDALHGIAEDLRVGQFDSFVAGWAAVASCPADMAQAMRAFAEFAHDRYRDTVALATQLAAHLALAAANYRLRDVAAAEGFGPRPAK